MNTNSFRVTHDKKIHTYYSSNDFAPNFFGRRCYKNFDSLKIFTCRKIIRHHICKMMVVVACIYKVNLSTAARLFCVDREKSFC